MKKHEADGLYYFDSRMFNKVFACLFGRERFHNAFPEGSVLITLANVRKAARFDVNLNWAASAMEEESKVTPDEYYVFTDSYYDSRKNSAKAFMDLLAKRARREGLLV